MSFYLVLSCWHLRKFIKIYIVVAEGTERHKSISSICISNLNAFIQLTNAAPSDGDNMDMHLDIEPYDMEPIPMERCVVTPQGRNVELQ